MAKKKSMASTPAENVEVLEPLQQTEEIADRLNSNDQEIIEEVKSEEIQPVQTVKSSKKNKEQIQKYPILWFNKQRQAAICKDGKIISYVNVPATAQVGDLICYKI